MVRASTVGSRSSVSVGTGDVAGAAVDVVLVISVVDVFVDVVFDVVVTLVGGNVETGADGADGDIQVTTAGTMRPRMAHMMMTIHHHFFARSCIAGIQLWILVQFGDLT